MRAELILRTITPSASNTPAHTASQRTLLPGIGFEIEARWMMRYGFLAPMNGT